MINARSDPIMSTPIKRLKVWDSEVSLQNLVESDSLTTMPAKLQRALKLVAHHLSFVVSGVLI